MGIAACLLALGAAGQGLPENSPSATPAASPPGQATVTVHQLLAPAKARSEVENARKAMARNDAEGAQRHLARALAAYPNYSIALTVQAVLELRAGQPEQAIADLHRAIEADPEYGLPYVALASAHNDAKRYDDALALLAKARRLLPTLWQTHLEMARARFGKGEDEQALGEITTALRLAPSTERAENLAILHFWRASVLSQLKDVRSAQAEYLATLKLDPQGEYSALSRQALDLLQRSPAR